MSDEQVPVTDAPAVEVEAPDAAPEVVADADAPAQPVTPAAPTESEKVQKRIDELVRRNSDLSRRLDALQRPAEPPPPVKPTIEPPSAELLQSNPAEFFKAQNEYVAALVKQGVSEQLARERSESQVQTVEKTFQQRNEEFAKKTPEYVEKVLRADTLPISETAQALIKELDNGPELALYLVNHEEEALKIMQLPQRRQDVELGRIAARLEKEATATPPPAPRVSQAPPPPARIEATDATVSIKPTDPESDKLSDQEWRRARDRQIARQRKT